jgi:hypothetical protein
MNMKNSGDVPEMYLHNKKFRFCPQIHLNEDAAIRYLLTDYLKRFIYCTKIPTKWLWSYAISGMSGLVREMTFRIN